METELEELEEWIGYSEIVQKATGVEGTVLLTGSVDASGVGWSL